MTKSYVGSCFNFFSLQADSINAIHCQQTAIAILHFGVFVSQYSYQLSHDFQYFSYINRGSIALPFMVK